MNNRDIKVPKMDTGAKLIHTLTFPIFNKLETVTVLVNAVGRVTKVSLTKNAGNLTGLDAIVAVAQLEVDKLRGAAIRALPEASRVFGDSHSR